MLLEPRLTSRVQERYQQLLGEGRLKSVDELQGYYEAFRQRFGPRQLRNLDGEALLSLMHDHGNRDSLVYWLEFKNDDDFPAIFGSIAGGSALKFGIYRRKETGAWMTGSPTSQLVLSLEEAVEIARKHRDQLIGGAQVLEGFAFRDDPSGPSDNKYAWLQRELNRAAPDVSDTAWGHKYFHMLYPEKLDDYHVVDVQRFHLIKLLQKPPAGHGRYLAAGRYVTIARELGMHMNHLTSTLNDLHGAPYRVWRVRANYQIKDWRHWEAMRDGGFVAIGWDALGDLSQVRYDQAGRERVKALMAEKYKEKGGWAQEIFTFVAAIEEGDLVLATEMSKVLGIGRVTGPYRYVTGALSSGIPHRHPVEWLTMGPWDLPVPLTDARVVKLVDDEKDIDNRLAAELQLLFGPPPPPASPGDADGRERVIRPPVQLSGIPGRVQSILERKQQVILYGPPGTGKTYWARRTARDLAALALAGVPYDEASVAEKVAIDGTGKDEGVVRMVTFHPSYGYEDFLEGYRPVAGQDALTFERRDGVFKRLCADARKTPGRPFYLIVDEINRGDIPRIFGELITALEWNKRGQPVTLPLSGERFDVPKNVYLIGTMNTADRSIALLDTALRRRFGFVELMPDYGFLGNVTLEGIPLGPWLKWLNGRIVQLVGRDARNRQIGHAYLAEGDVPVRDFAAFARILREDILPLLEEYCYEDYRLLADIFAGELVDRTNQRIREELFEPEQRDELIAALARTCSEIVTTSDAVRADAAAQVEVGAVDDAPVPA